MKHLKVPETFIKRLNPFRKLFSAKYHKKFSQYIFALIFMHSPVSLTRMAQMYGYTHHTRFSRLLEEDHWSLESLLSLRQKTIRQHTQEHAGRHRHFLIIDDTAAEKRGEEMEGAGYHFNDKYKKAVWAHNFVTLLSLIADMEYQEQHKFCQKTAMYRKNEDCKKYGVEFQSKIALACKLIKDFRAPAGTRPVVLSDAWYCAAEFIRAILKKHYDYVLRLKSNRYVIYQGKKIQASQLAKLVFRSPSGRRIVKVRNNGHTYRTCLINVIIPKVGKVHLLISKEQGRRNTRFFITNRTDWSARQMILSYSRRFPVEQYYKEVKQLFCFKDYHVRKASAILRHIELACTAHMILEMLRSEEKRKRSMVEIVDAVREAALEETWEEVYAMGQAAGPMTQLKMAS
jgi:hypothetical protein